VAKNRRLAKGLDRAWYAMVWRPPYIKFSVKYVACIAIPLSAAPSLQSACEPAVLAHIYSSVPGRSKMQCKGDRADGGTQSTISIGSSIAFGQRWRKVAARQTYGHKDIDECGLV